MKRYEEIDHTGDIGILIYGESLEEIYENGGYAYFDLICDTDTIEEKEEVKIEVEGASRADLLRNFLQELLLKSQIDDYLFRSFEVREMAENHLVVLARGEKLDSERHFVEIEMKAITYHMLEVKERDNGTWRARVIFDI